MHLSELYPKFQLLTPENVKILKGYHISSVQDFLSLDPEKLVNILDISYTQVVKLHDDIFISLVGAPESSFEIFSKLRRNEVVIKSGALKLDNILSQGGFKTGRVYEIFGQAGSGKTQLCFSVAVEGLIKGMEVCYVDTKNDLVPQRILQILQARTNNSSSLDILNKINVSKCFNALNLLQTLRLISEKVKSKNNQIKLVILDNLVSNLLPILTEDLKLASSYSSRMSQCLQKLASQGCCVVTTNNARHFDGELTPALGKIWTRLADIRLKIEYSKLEETRKLKIVKGEKNQVGTECPFTINKAGVQ